MKEKNQVIHIAIKQHEKDMDNELSREKKEEISELLTNHNQLRSQDELAEVIHKLHEACKKGDLELIEIYLNETIEDETNNEIQDQQNSLFI